MDAGKSVRAAGLTWVWLGLGLVGCTVGEIGFETDFAPGPEPGARLDAGASAPDGGDVLEDGSVGDASSDAPARTAADAADALDDASIERDADPWGDAASDAAQADSASADASVDGGIDASADGGIDASADGGIDASADGGIDASADGGIDASVDGGIDASIDASQPPPVDAGADDASVDAGPGDDWLAGRSAKRGVAYNFCDWADSQGEVDLDLLRTGTTAGSGVVWSYNWGPGPSSCVAAAIEQSPRVEFVPMAWGLSAAGAGCDSGGACFNDGLSRDALAARIPDSSRYLLGFNEPNFSHQSNLTPRVAARAWRHLEAVADAKGLGLVGPATNFCDPNPAADHGGSCVSEASELSVSFPDYSETFPAGHRHNAFAWAELFYDECSAAGAAGHDCRIDYQAGHVYSWWGLGWYIDIFKRKAGLLPTTEAHCQNGVEDEDEFGVDCGGNACAACSAWARAQFAKALWVTEFAPSTDDGPSTDQAQRLARASAYIQSELDILEGDDFVYRYAWFMPKTSIGSLDHVDLLTEELPVRRTAAGAAYLDHAH